MGGKRWSEEDQTLLRECVAEWGRQWRRIADEGVLPGRSPSSLRDQWDLISREAFLESADNAPVSVPVAVALSLRGLPAFETNQQQDAQPSRRYGLCALCFALRSLPSLFRIITHQE